MSATNREYLKKEIRRAIEDFYGAAGVGVTGEGQDFINVAFPKSVSFDITDFDAFFNHKFNTRLVLAENNTTYDLFLPEHTQPTKETTSPCDSTLFVVLFVLMGALVGLFGILYHTRQFSELLFTLKMILHEGIDRFATPPSVNPAPMP